MFGALLGVGTQMYSNALRKLPYMRRKRPFLSFLLYWLFYRNKHSECPTADPWEHVLGMGLGALFVNQLIKFDAKAQEDLDKLLIKAKQANERRYFGNIFTLPVPFLITPNIVGIGNHSHWICFPLFLPSHIFIIY